MSRYRRGLMRALCLLLTLALFAAPVSRGWTEVDADELDLNVGADGDIELLEGGEITELPDAEWEEPDEIPEAQPDSEEDLRLLEQIKADIFRREEITLYCNNEYEIEDSVPEYPQTDFRLYADNRDVAAVSKLGKVMTFEEGDCTITAVCDDGSVDECLVHVVPTDRTRVRIALTFDDGPGKYANDLLDFLASRDVKVTFFLVGKMVSGYKTEVRRMYAEGHEIGNHTYSHVKLSTVTKSEIISEIDKCNEAIYKVIGAYPTVMRPPYGGHNSKTEKNVALPMICWSVDTRDWENKDPEYVCEQVVNGATDGAIILCHEVHPTTIEGVKMAIDILLARGVEFMTVTDLLTEDGTVLKNGQIYHNRR